RVRIVIHVDGHARVIEHRSRIVRAEHRNGPADGVLINARRNRDVVEQRDRSIGVEGAEVPGDHAAGGGAAAGNVEWVVGQSLLVVGKDGGARGGGAGVRGDDRIPQRIAG